MIQRFLAALGRLLGRAPRGRGYITARETVEAARREGLSVCDYVERLWNQQGQTEQVVARMASLGLLPERPCIVEIGPGTGRYLEKILQRCRPEAYEIYETADDWAQWLAATYPVRLQPADGVSLRESSAAAADLVHAHGVFVYLGDEVTWNYFREMQRVTRTGGAVVFDYYPEEVAEGRPPGQWQATYLARDKVLAAWQAQGFALIDSFRHPHGGVFSEYLVFRRQASAQ